MKGSESISHAGAAVSLAAPDYKAMFRPLAIHMARTLDRAMPGFFRPRWEVTLAMCQEWDVFGALVQGRKHGSLIYGEMRMWDHINGRHIGAGYWQAQIGDWGDLDFGWAYDDKPCGTTGRINLTPAIEEFLHG